MTLAPLPIKYLIVGIAALILVSSVMFWLSSKGTFKSALTNTFLPFKSASLKSPTLFLAMATTPLTALPEEPNDLTLEATWRAKRGSAAANPRRRVVGLREEEGRETCEAEDGEARAAREVAVDLRREKVVGAEAEAIVKCLK